MMKKAMIAGLAFGTMVVPAMSADMYVRSPPPPLMPVCEWCGVYLGANAGLSVGVDSFNTSVFANRHDTSSTRA
jgi:hypothetical protein